MYSSIFWVDCETTGLDARKHFAFQISYIITKEGKTLTSRTLSSRPDNYADFQFDAGARHVHGFSDAQIIALPPEKEVFPMLIQDLNAYCSDKLTIAGYNVNFDIRFLKAVFARNAASPNNGTEYSKLAAFYKYFYSMPCDIIQLAQNFRTAGKLNLPNLQLSTVCTHFGIPTQNAHNSMADITNTKRIFDTLMGLPAPIDE